MKDQKRLSVVVPGFNTPPKWWARSVGSVRKACGPEDEIICVDDGSGVAVDPRLVGADVDARVRLVRKENGGLASARNFGMDLMRGKYVTFVDSDDEIRPETFSRCLDSLEKTGGDIAIYGVEVLWADEKLRKVDSPPDRDYGRLAPSDVIALQKANLLNYVCNKVYRTGFLESAAKDGERRLSFHLKGMPCEDIIFNLGCLAAGAKWVSVDYAGYMYYHRTNGTLVSAYKPFCMDGLTACADAWRNYAMTLDETERKKFQDLYSPSSKNLLAKSWRNIWLNNSPYSLLDRWRWLKGNSALGGFALFVKTGLFFLARRYLYFRFLRRLHLKKMHPHAVDIGDDCKR